jgi:hypothetical protein
MARPLPLEFPGALYHVTARGKERRNIFLGNIDGDRAAFLIVQRDGYLLELARYLVLNPVRAGMVRTPGDWPWSSYRASVGEVPAPPSLQTGWLLRVFCRRPVGCDRRIPTVSC